MTRFVEPAYVLCLACKSNLRPFSPASSTSNYVGAAGLVSAISRLRHLQMKHRGVGGDTFHRPPGRNESSTSCFRLMPRPRALAMRSPVRRVALIRWLFRWLFLGPSLRSIRSSGPAANRPGRALTCRFPRTRTLDLSRGFAGTASLLAEIFGV